MEIATHKAGGGEREAHRGSRKMEIKQRNGACDCHNVRTRSGEAYARSREAYVGSREAYAISREAYVGSREVYARPREAYAISPKSMS